MAHTRKAHSKTTNKLQTDNLHRVFANNIRKRRKQLGYSQEKLGEFSNLHRNYIGGIEQETRNPSLKSMQKIAETLQTPLSALLNKSYSVEQKNYAIVEIVDNDYVIHDITDDKNKKIIEDLING